MTEETAKLLVGKIPKINLSHILTGKQESRWRPLTVPTSFFEDCNQHKMQYILPEKSERMLYCFDCDRIEFRNERGITIWSTAGSGQMDKLPRDIGAWIFDGKSKVIWD
jgi:hypothetical protein